MPTQRVVIEGRKQTVLRRTRAWRKLRAQVIADEPTDQHPSALSQVARLDQAAAHQREAIAFVADLDESDVDVEGVWALSSETEELLAKARADRTNAEQLARAASETTRTLARRLVDEAYSLRDIGVVLGVSHHRVAQILGN